MADIREKSPAVWSTFGRNDPSFLTISWVSAEEEPSVLWYGTNPSCGQRAATEGKSGTLHHVEVPMPVSGPLYYRLETKGALMPVEKIRGWDTDELRIAMAGDWGWANADMSAVVNDDVHLFLTGGDQIKSLHEENLESEAAKTNIRPHTEFLGSYPDLFAHVPIMPVLGNHDHEIHRRDKLESLTECMHDKDATAFKMVFPLPDKGWCWRFDIPAFDLRIIGLDLNHVYDQGTFLEACHDFDENSEQLAYYRDVMALPKKKFILTINNEKNESVRNLAGGEWGRLITQGTLTATGFGYFAERAETRGYPWLNSSLSGKGDRFPDSESKFLVSENSYLFFRFKRGQNEMTAEIRRLEDGAVLDRITRSALG
jgi:hypothetical protein